MGLRDARGWRLQRDLIRDFTVYLIADPCTHACLGLGEEVLGSLPGGVGVGGITLESRDFTPCCLAIDALIHIVFDQLTLRVSLTPIDLSSPSTLRIGPTSYFFRLDDTTHRLDPGGSCDRPLERCISARSSHTLHHAHGLSRSRNDEQVTIANSC